MEYNQTYKELSSKVCECVYDIIYKTEPEGDGHINLASLSTRLFLELMDVIDKTIK